MSSKYMSSSQAAAKWGLSARRVALLCEQERIRDAEKIGNSWVIPIDAEKPIDARIKSGRYIKNVETAINQENKL